MCCCCELIAPLFFNFFLSFSISISLFPAFPFIFKGDNNILCRKEQQREFTMGRKVTGRPPGKPRHGWKEGRQALAQEESKEEKHFQQYCPPSVLSFSPFFLRRSDFWVYRWESEKELTRGRIFSNKSAPMKLSHSIEISPPLIPETEVIIETTVCHLMIDSLY